MTVEIREAAYEDAETIATIHVASWQAAYPAILPERFLKNLSIAARTVSWQNQLRSGQSRVLMGRVDEAVAGWVAFGACRDDDKDGNWGEVMAIYLLQAYWGRGIGARLVDAARHALRDAGYSHAGLWVLAENPLARAFYERIGFRYDDLSKAMQIGGVPLTEMRYVCALTD